MQYTVINNEKLQQRGSAGRYAPTPSADFWFGCNLARVHVCVCGVSANAVIVKVAVCIRHSVASVVLAAPSRCNI